jgi:hypothetical protein
MQGYLFSRSLPLDKVEDLLLHETFVGTLATGQLGRRTRAGLARILERSAREISVTAVGALGWSVALRGFEHAAPELPAHERHGGAAIREVPECPSERPVRGASTSMRRATGRPVQPPSVVPPTPPP